LQKVVEMKPPPQNRPPYEQPPPNHHKTEKLLFLRDGFRIEKKKYIGVKRNRHPARKVVRLAVIRKK